MGVSGNRIADYINGKHLQGKLVNGKIDLDNLDNFRRWAKGVGLFKAEPHNPLLIIKSIKVRNDEVVFSCPQEIEKWSKLRYEVYNWIYDSDNLTISAMLHVALQLALEQGMLTKEFFSLTEGEAIEYLKKIPKAKDIMEMLEKNNLFMRVFDRKSEDKNDLAIKEYLSNNFATDEFYVHSFKSNDVKEGVSGGLKPHYRVAVFLHPKHKNAFDEINRRLKAL